MPSDEIVVRRGMRFTSAERSILDTMEANLEVDHSVGAGARSGQYSNALANLVKALNATD